MVHLRDLVGVHAIALGSDYDGTTTVPFDTTGLVYITESLLQTGFSHDEIGNFFVLLLFISKYLN